MRLPIAVILLVAATPLPFYVHASLRRSRPRMKLSLA